VTVIRDAAGRYFASFVIETAPAALPETGPVIGIDLGLKHFAVLSDGRKIASPRFLRRTSADGSAQPAGRGWTGTSMRR
jgi:putative transposase